jgi:peptide/nickel transport system substrate-binding protein
MLTIARASFAAVVFALVLAAPAGADTAGKVTFVTASDVDYIDPGQTWYTFGYMVEYAVNRSLYGSRPGELEPVPDLASGPPEIAEDNRSLTVRLRPGVRFAPPVNREVVAADVKYAFQRAFTRHVPNGYISAYFSDIVGAPRRPTSATPALAGIETPDAHTLVFRLRAPTAPGLAAALVLPVTMPVPREYAQPYDRKSPSTYDDHVAFTGPYMVANDARGKLVGWQRGRRIQLVRNPNWDPATDFRPAALDSITIDEGSSGGDLRRLSRRTLRDSGLMCCDSGMPPPGILRVALRDTPAQVGRAPGGGTRWFALRTTVKPFDNVNVRRAVVAGFNRVALRKTHGGAITGPIAQHFIPPGMPGFAESGGKQGFTEFDFMRHPRGDLALARAYLRKAGYRKGRYTGHHRLLMIAASGEFADTSRAARRQFRKLGFRLRFKPVDPPDFYTKFCQAPRAKLAICGSVGWFKDFLDPESMLRPPFDGDLLSPEGVIPNFSALDVPRINSAIDAARLLTGADRATAWAGVNRLVVGQAVGIPYVWDENYQLASKDVIGAMDPLTSTWSLSFTSLR